MDYYQMTIDIRYSDDTIITATSGDLVFVEAKGENRPIYVKKTPWD